MNLILGLIFISMMGYGMKKINDYNNKQQEEKINKLQKIKELELNIMNITDIKEINKEGILYVKCSNLLNPITLIKLYSMNIKYYNDYLYLINTEGHFFKEIKAQKYVNTVMNRKGIQYLFIIGAQTAIPNLIANVKIKFADLSNTYKFNLQNAYKAIVNLDSVINFICKKVNCPKNEFIEKFGSYIECFNIKCIDIEKYNNLFFQNIVLNEVFLRLNISIIDNEKIIIIESISNILNEIVK